MNADGDGYGSDIYLGNSCSMTGVPNSDDCDDNDPSSPNASINPMMVWIPIVMGKMTMIVMVMVLLHTLISLD